jgi:hypothetical protein
MDDTSLGPDALEDPDESAPEPDPLPSEGLLGTTAPDGAAELVGAFDVQAA